MAHRYDCIIIGAGPAGLTAATYLARFRRRVLVIDAGQSRARRIPVSHNCPGFPFGIAGNQLLSHFRTQAERYDVPFVSGFVSRVEQERAGGFRSSVGHSSYRSPVVLLATGIVDRLPPMPDVEAAIASGSLRLCAVCDGYEARDERIGVFAPVRDGLAHARFLRTFSTSVCVLSPDERAPSADELLQAEETGVALHLGVRALRACPAGCCAELADGRSLPLDTIYPVLGCVPATDPAALLGVATDATGKLIVNSFMETSVHGLYAAGDVVSGLNQISVAVGHAAVAATAIHDRLPCNPRARR
jgi:thioredoxin reductase (NADPH)